MNTNACMLYYSRYILNDMYMSVVQIFRALIPIDLEGCQYTYSDLPEQAMNSCGQKQTQCTSVRYMMQYNDR